MSSFSKAQEFSNQLAREKEKEESLIEQHPEKLIDSQIVFRNAMTQDFKKIIELALVDEKITSIDAYNPCLKQMGATLRRLDLSVNYIATINNLECLTNLRELNLSYNQIRQMENLHKLTSLRKLYIDRNHIKEINGIKHLRKLEKLSLRGNRIRDP